MSEIDIQNAKQIRDPMTVMIKMEVPEEVSVSYSNFVNEKIKDEELTERSWPMRALADLQGDGFALDGSRVLYDPAVTASAANGKIGVRGDIGQDLQFKVTGDSTINGLSIAATGADSVIYNGHTAYFSDGQVIIPVGASSITLEFPANEPDERVEVSLTMPGTSLQVTNDSIISCIVSLRSDLTIENPTLPESEINIEVYNDVDISEVVASIPDDSPLTYSAGYTGDMSPERKFYISGQVTWADNVLTIHAVDAVHFLDKEADPMIFYTHWGANIYPTLTYLCVGFSYLLNMCGVDVIPICQPFYSAADPAYAEGTGYAEQLVFPRANVRELIAFANNIFHLDDIPPGAVSNYTSFRFGYVDAGIPTLDTLPPSVSRLINESDCGEVKRFVEPQKNTVNVTHKQEKHTIEVTDKPVGSISWIKGEGAFPSIDNKLICVLRGYGLSSYDAIPGAAYFFICRELPITAGGYLYQGDPETLPAKIRRLRNGPTILYNTGSVLIDDQTLQNIKSRHDETSIYTQVIPWDAPYDSEAWLGGKSQEEAWKALVRKGVIASDDQNFDLNIYGTECILYDNELTYTSGNSGNTINIEEKLHGCCRMKDRDNNVTVEVFPSMAYQSLLDRSNITGSFIWKGDPRMQPRDVVEFHRLDGTVEDITLENITLHHEGGGTYAEITYRKGVC